jgi:AmmeMemoRadiSam system protein B
MSIRRATHAGSWYTDDGRTLNKQLTGWLEEVGSVHDTAKGIIVPHAGYRYSGPSAAYGYKTLNPDTTKRIFVLGPSHHAYFSRCGLSRLAEYETPLQNLRVDREITEALHKTGQFDYLSQDVEEAEHSLEMHLPYIAKIMGNREFTIIPIMVGSVSKEDEEMYGKLLAPYLLQEGVAFVVSSDFCHWGKRFSYTPYNPEHGPIHKSIEEMDKEGMNLIAAGDPLAFVAYLKKTKNTICGRHPITIFMWAMHYAKIEHKKPFAVEPTHYEQSSQCVNKSDSSVSYAVLVATAAQ